jgi:hypothetical protein
MKIYGDLRHSSVQGASVISFMSPTYKLNERLGWLRKRCGLCRKEKNNPYVGYRTRILRLYNPWYSHCTNWATPAETLLWIHISPDECHGTWTSELKDSETWTERHKNCYRDHKHTGHDISHLLEVYIIFKRLLKLGMEVYLRISAKKKLLSLLVQ